MLESQESQLLADLAAKKCPLDAARSNLAYTRISTPSDGVVGERKVLPGQMVNPGTQVISLVENDIWVEANYRGTQLRRVAVGDAASIIEETRQVKPGSSLTGTALSFALRCLLPSTF